MNIEILLKQGGKSLTKERKDIFAFMETKHMFTAQEIGDYFADISRASVFRTLGLFVSLGIIRRIPFSERGEVYELNDINHHHEHMKCNVCETILSFDSHGICKSIFKEAKEKGFIIQEHSISVRGICMNCSIS